MQTTIDAAGRIVVPKSLREELRWAAGQQLELRAVDGRLEVELPRVAMRLERRDGVLVAVPERPVSALTAEQVRETLERTRR